MPSLSQIEYALAVAREGSFSSAARSCAISQPALSAQVAKLEETLGCKLFDRSARPVLPTGAGLALLPKLQAVMDALQAMQQSAQALHGAVQGSYRLGIIPTVAPCLLPLFLADFRRRYPDVQLGVKELTTEAIMEDLRRDRLDGAIMATPLGAADLNEEPLYAEPIHLYASTQLPVPCDEGGHASLAALPLERLVMMNEGHCLRTQALELCLLARGREPGGFSLEVGSLGSLMAVLHAGAWFTLLPELAIPQAQTLGRAYPLRGKTPHRQIGMVYRRSDLGAGIRAALCEAIRCAVPERLTEAVQKTPILVLVP